MKRPLRKTYDDKKAQLQKEIDDMTLEAAESKYMYEQAMKKATGLSKQHEAARAGLKKAQTNLQSTNQEKKMVNREIKKILQNEGKSAKGLRLNGDPVEMKKQLSSEITQLRASLQMDNQSAAEEKKTIRRLKILQEQFDAVESRVKAGVQDTVKQLKEKKQSYRESQKEHDLQWTNVKAAKAQVDDAWTEATKIRERSNQLQESMKEKKKKKLGVDREFNEKEKEYKQNMADINEITSHINRLKAEENMEAPKAKPVAKKEKSPKKESKKDDKEKNVSKVKSPKKGEKKEEEMTEEERQKLNQQKIEDRRKRALEEYNRMKAQVTQKTKEFKSKKKPDEKTAEETPTAAAQDPNAEAKAICQSLIVALTSMKPPERKQDNNSGRKKKKKNKKGGRLKFNPIVFTNFERVGVAIPKSTKDLDDSIKALKDRMVSYDKEDTKETETESTNKDQE